MSYEPYATPEYYTDTYGGRYSTPRMPNAGAFSSGAKGAIVKKNLK